NQARKLNDGRNLFIIEKMVKPFYDAYQSALKKRGEIDFTDAILQATDYCSSNRFPLKYKYIIVDEFQDISFDRYRLLMSIRTQTPLGKIFAVGDDWQSIYRFSGSDMGLFSDFPKYFGFTTMCKIESTYRFAQPAIGISSAFIQKNKSQVKKNVKSPKKGVATTISFEGYGEDEELARNVAAMIRAIPFDKSVYILSRYAFDFNIFKGGGYNYREHDRNIEITIYNRKVRCLTVHQAKGLEADHIFLLKCDSDIYGFPSMISDDPVLEYLLSQQEESVEFAEERRVFYVAITRAKLSTTIFYRRNNPSVFVDEIITETEDDGHKKCPCCGYGHLKIIKQGFAKTGQYFVSLGCTNTLAGCDYFHTEYYANQPPQQVIDRLIYTPPKQ
ncbi:MAG: UvrD-helicase domain-containing protein, partial [Paludibacteraceae bacterium]|nr:UvrD-helicase domain-containing protein [Paludibacteraceae bacterium]